MSPARIQREIDHESFEAALVDLDGVVTDTARVHAACWKQVFDDLLARRARILGVAFRPFDLDRDYRRFVDGRARRDGIREFLASRDIRLPEGSETDGDAEEEDESEGGDTVEGVARRKNDLFSRILEREGVATYPGTVRWLRKIRADGLRTAIVSASHHCVEVLRAADLEELFDARVDGHVADHLGLPGKPAPDVFLEAARRLGVEPSRALVVEDARSGVAAGRAGGFGRVIGVARHGDAAALAAAGADIVVRDLDELLAVRPEEPE